MNNKVDNSIILDYIYDKLKDLGYKITYDDIDSSSTDVLGIYLRDTGGPMNSLVGGGINRLDINIRLHGDVVSGSQERCLKDLVEIEDRLVVYNMKLTNINILGCSLRGRGVMLGKTSKKIPVYNISFLITFE